MGNLNFVEFFVAHKTGLLINGLFPKTFWVELSPIAGWVKFALIDGTLKAYLPVELRQAHEPTPSPLISLQGVLWSRQGEISQRQAIDFYQEAGDLIARFLEKSTASGSHHAA